MYNRGSLETDYIAELEKVCGKKGVRVIRLAYPFEKSVLYIADLKSIIVASNCDEKQLEALAFIAKNS